MGQLEVRSGKRTRKKNLQKMILKTIVLSGILAIGLLAPNVVGAMGKLGILPHKRQKESVSFSASKMVKKGLLKFNGKFYELTPLGQARMRKWEFADFKLQAPRKWDKKWRVIIFDIPEKKRKIRDEIRSLFKKARLYRLQDSVWVYPYDCEDIITLLKTDFGVGKDVLYLIVDELESDKYLREFFGLN